MRMGLSFESSASCPSEKISTAFLLVLHSSYNYLIIHKFSYNYFPLSVFHIHKGPSLPLGRLFLIKHKHPLYTFTAPNFDVLLGDSLHGPTKTGAHPCSWRTWITLIFKYLKNVHSVTFFILKLQVFEVGTVYLCSTSSVTVDL